MADGTKMGAGIGDLDPTDFELLERLEGCDMLTLDVGLGQYVIGIGTMDNDGVGTLDKIPSVFFSAEEHEGEIGTEVKSDEPPFFALRFHDEKGIDMMIDLLTAMKNNLQLVARKQ